MRPQHIAAENDRDSDALGDHDVASMRPQHIAAENRSPSAPPATADPGFNEAAAYRCGKPPRTRYIPARCSARFNEAAAYRCGKPRWRARRSAWSGCFNEAAAYRCGKPEAVARPEIAQIDASMRPQHIAAENLPGRARRASGTGRFNEAAAYRCGKHRRATGRRRLQPASMRPQHIAAENERGCAPTMPADSALQ